MLQGVGFGFRARVARRYTCAIHAGYLDNPYHKIPKLMVNALKVADALENNKLERLSKLLRAASESRDQ